MLAYIPYMDPMGYPFSIFVAAEYINAVLIYPSPAGWPDRKSFNPQSVVAKNQYVRCQKPSVIVIIIIITVLLLYTIMYIVCICKTHEKCKMQTHEKLNKLKKKLTC